MKVKALPVVVAGLSVLGGCAGPMTDTTPKNPTMVIQGKYSMGGLYLPEASGTEVVYTRPDRRRVDNDVEFDSFMLGWADFSGSDIYRMDQNKLWMLNNDDESYRECQLGGCLADVSFNFNSVGPGNSDSNGKAYEGYNDRGCQVSLKTNEFNVQKTGNSRMIGGYSTNEYRVGWEIEMADQSGRVDTNLFQFVFWTTAPEVGQSPLWQVHQQAMDNYYQALEANHPMARLIGPEVYDALSGFIEDLDRIHNGAITETAEKLAAIEGYPLATKVEWFQKLEACRGASGSRHASTVDLNKGVGGVANAAANALGNFIKDKRDAAVTAWTDNALVRYEYEATQVSEQMVHDSTFMVPEDYTLVRRR